MVSIDLKDAYLQVPIHPDSRRYLRFMAFNKVCQFKVPCFGLSTAPQVFTRVMAPVSAILHTLGIRLRRYLDDCLIQASSREQVLLSLRTVLQLCNSLGIVVNWEKSQLVPTQRICYLGVLLDSVSFRASPAQKRVDKLLSIGDVFLSSVEQPAKSWLELLGVLSSLTQLIPGGTAADVVVSVSTSLSLGSEGSRCSGSVVSGDRAGPPLVVRSRTPRARRLPSASVSPARLVVRRLGCRLGSSPRRPGRFRPLVAGRGSRFHQPAGALAIFYALQHFLPLVRDTSVAVFSDNTTALAYLKNQGGTRSAVLNRTAQELLRWTELHSVTLLPQFIMGRNNVLADSLSRPNQILGSEWTLKMPVFHQLRQRWPVAIDLFATSLNHRCIPYFSPFHDPNSIRTDAFLQQWNGWQAYAFPPYALIPAVLKKLRSSSGVLMTIIAPYWPERPWFPELLELVVDSPVALPLDKDLLSQLHFHRQHLGLSRLALHAWRLSSDL